MVSARKPKLLIVDDGDRYVELAHALLRSYAYATRCDLPGPCWDCTQRTGCEQTHAHDATEAEEALELHPDVDVVLLDVAFDLPEARLLPSTEPDLERRRRLQGIAILGDLRRRRGDLPVILMTSQEELRIEHATPALSADELVTLAGADAFDARAMELLIERVLARSAEAPESGSFLFGRSRAMARLRRDVLTLAPTSLPMLLLGETGTGKSAISERVIHLASGRDGPFVAADLSAIPPQLLAAELFGTARGAFSGAVEREGLISRAHRGTLFLDEVGNLPLDVQRMLLLTLQDRRVTRLGEVEPRNVDIKLIAATHADLGEMVRRGEFRADLLARLNPAAAVTLPPLRERQEDLEGLMGGFLRRTFAGGADRRLLTSYFDGAGLPGPPAASIAFGQPRNDEGRGVVFVVAPAMRAVLESHVWPGNVRELELFVANAAVFALADAVRAIEAGRGPAGQSARLIPVPAKLVRELLSGPAAPPPTSQPATNLAFSPAHKPADVARQLERSLYQALYTECGGDFEAMAERLLLGDRIQNARRVRLRFNQLGLRVRTPKNSNS